ncbi:DUF2975 domain-containing protein [Streptomyces abyssomicinicus]|uniref:DUF2975 domain-containing protein n=1 Tax=Streptomyces abyssomicinicus TaxID=574929 RepID=UPI0012508C28|nr:DUF2975 domain-containing protein [Streptomyces abyssomicinicus]
MGKLAVLALRAVIAALLAGSLFIQAVMLPLIFMDMQREADEVAQLRVPFVVIVFLGVVAAQVVLVSVWRLVTMARRGTVFSHAAFRYVDLITGGFATAAVLIWILGVFLASLNSGGPEEDQVAPGIVLLVGGAGLAVFGVALVVLVLRTLLTQAVDRDVEASRMRAELDEVI